ncbi:MAG: antibiotic resistance protein MarC [Phenylobacterium zucineum]|nr:MAG: antibiotic resistance protein MarC [Phenylobacterium zucineum]
MSQAEFAVNFFVALFALLDPVGNVPLFAAATAGARSRDRAWIAVYIALFAFGFLTFFYFSGLSLLEFFGISLAAFRIAGGIILFLLGLEMARDDFTATFTEATTDAPGGSGRAYVRKRFERMIVPFAMPLLIGPGAISSVVIYASQARQFGLQGAAIGVGVIGAVALATLLSFLATPILSKILGRIGLSIVVRVLGLILCALAVQFILSGLAESTSGFIRPSIANPYGH